MSNRLVACVLFAFLVSTNALEYNKLNDFLFSGDYEFIDLSYPFDNSTVYWPNNQPFKFTKKRGEITSDGSWYAANEFAAAEHGGTHIDAPNHFHQSGAYVGEIPLEKLIVPLIIVDISTQVNDNANFVLYKNNLDNLLNDNFGKPCVILFKFGWSKFYNDKNKYLGVGDSGLNFPDLIESSSEDDSDAEFDMHVALSGTKNRTIWVESHKKQKKTRGLSVEVADWIVKSYKNVVGVGMDVASADPGSSNDYLVHKMLNKAGLYILENVNLTMEVPDYGCTAFMLPMNIAMGSGAPVRIVAVCPKRTPISF